MAVHFWDSSGLTKRYVRETGSAWVAGLFQPGLHEHVIAAITPVEILAAITRRGRGGTLAPTVVTAACALFRADLLTDYLTIKLTDALLANAMDLAGAHALRGYDAVQLAAALELNDLRIRAGMQPIRFISADRELIAVAIKVGLNTDDPNTRP